MAGAAPAHIGGFINPSNWRDTRQHWCFGALERVLALEFLNWVVKPMLMSRGFEIYSFSHTDLRNAAKQELGYAF